MHNLAPYRTVTQPFAHVLGTKYTKLGWNDARAGKWRELETACQAAHTDYLMGRRTYTLFATRCPEGIAPPAMASGTKLLDWTERNGVFEIIDRAFDDAWDDMVLVDGASA